MTVRKGLDSILNTSKTEYLTFDTDKPSILLFIDWYEDVYAVREHYEKSLKPQYVRCCGKETCPLCQMSEKYPSLKIKFRVYDPSDEKVKVVSLAKSHIASLNQDFSLDEIDPTKTFVKIIRNGKSPTDTKYSARAYKGTEFKRPNLAELTMPDLEKLVQPHSQEEIRGFIDAAMGAIETSTNATTNDEAVTTKTSNLPF